MNRKKLYLKIPFQLFITDLKNADISLFHSAFDDEMNFDGFRVSDLRKCRTVSSVITLIMIVLFPFKLTCGTAVFDKIKLCAQNDEYFRVIVCVILVILVLILLILFIRLVSYYISFPLTVKIQKEG